MTTPFLSVPIFSYPSAPFGQLFTFVASTTTPKVTYSDAAGTVPNTNPVILDANGLATVRLDVGAYDFVLKDQTGQTTEWSALDYDQSLIYYAQTQAEINAGINPVNFSYPQGNVFRYETTAQINDWIAGTAVFDHGPLIQNAVNTGQPVFMPAGSPTVKSAIAIATPGQRISGTGLATIISVPSSFNLAAAGVFVLSQSNQPGAELRDFMIVFSQPDTATHASLIAYPPAIYMQSQPRVKLSRLKIVNAKTAIDARGNSGGSYFEDLELCHYDFGIRMNGMLDTTRVIDCQFWPFGPPGSNGEITTNQQVLYNLATNIGMECVDVNSLMMSGVVFLCGLGCIFSESTPGTGQTWANITDTGFDSNNGISMSSGTIMVSDSYFSNLPGTQSVIHTGGTVIIHECEFFWGALTVAGISSNNTSTLAARMTLNDCIMNGFPANQTCVSVLVPTSETDVIITNNQFSGLPQNSSLTNPIFSVAGGSSRLNFSGNLAFEKGTGTGNLLSILADGGTNIITGNTLLGWGVSLPAGAISTTLSNNTGCANNGVAILSSNKGTGAFSASTTVAITHGVNAYGSAPTAGQITITPTSAPGAVTWFVSATSTTTFTLTASGSTSMSFGWHVSNANGS